MKTLPVFNKWVLVSVLAVLSLLLAAALMAPATNWYYALSNEASPEFNAVYFPLRGVFALLQKQQILFSYTGFNCFLAALSALSFWLVAILAYKWQKVLGVLVLSLSYSATISVVWLSVLSPAVALLQLGMAALLLLQAIKPKCPLPLFVPLQALSFLLVMGTSALWMPVVAAVILVELWLDKGVYKNLIAFALAALATLFFDPLFLRNLTAFIAAQPGITYYFNAVTYQGDNLPRFYAFAQLIRFYSPYLLLAAVASGFFFRQIKSIEKIPAFLMVFMGACLLLLQPGFAYKGAYGWVTLQYPLALIAVVLLEPMLQKISPKMMKWALPAVLLLCSAAGIYRFRFFSPYQYAESSLPFYSSTNEIGSNNGDYLNMGGISAVLTYHQEHPDDTLGLNFELPVFLRDISTQKIPYEKKDLRKYDMGIFSRAALTIQEQASPSFPPENVEEAQLYRGISMAVAAPPQGVIAKAYKILYSRNTGQAVADFKELRDSFPNNIQVWYGLARAQFRFNKWDDALQSCQLGLINLPGHWGLSVLVGEVYRKQNKNEKAIQQWRKTLKMRPDKSRNYWLMGEYHYRSDSLEKAEVELIKAVSCGDAMSQRAAKTLQAIDSIRTIPAFANGLENYFINELNAIENPDEKQFAHLDRLIERMKFYMDLDSTNALLKSHLGIAFMMKGDFPHAAIAFEKAIELNPNYPQMRQYLAMARINWGAQKFEEDSLQAAVFHFRYALDYEPDNENARSNLSVAYNELAKKAMEEDDLETAYAIIRAAIFYNQKNPESFNQMGDLQLRINQADSAEIAYNQAYLLDKNNVETLRRLIDFYKDRNEPYKVNVYSKRLDELERRNKRGLLK